MNHRLEEFLAARLARYEVVPHPEAITAREQAASAHTSGWSWAKAVLVRRFAVPEAMTVAGTASRRRHGRGGP